MSKRSTPVRSMGCLPSLLRPTTTCLDPISSGCGPNSGAKLTGHCRTSRGTTQPVFDDDLFTTFVKIVAISADEGVDISPSLLRREALRFADAARKVPQTRRVKPYGLPDEEINVEINGTALSTLGLSVDDIARTLALSDSRTPAGKLASPTTALTIDVAGDFGDAQAVRDTFISLILIASRVSELAMSPL